MHNIHSSFIGERCGGALRQDFLADCVPMRDGIASAGFADYVAG